MQFVGLMPPLVDSEVWICSEVLNHIHFQQGWITRIAGDLLTATVIKRIFCDQNRNAALYGKLAAGHYVEWTGHVFSYGGHTNVCTATQPMTPSAFFPSTKIGSVMVVKTIAFSVVPRRSMMLRHSIWLDEYGRYHNGT